MAKQQYNIIKPQQGFQTNLLASQADIKIGGGAAGGGKTFALLVDAMRYMHIKGFGGTIFRRTTPEITGEGGLWDESVKLFSNLRGAPRSIEGKLKWVWGNGNKLDFRHLEHEKDRLHYQGLQFPFIGFDELTHFTKKQFFYLLSRLRSTCGVNPYLTATCNPESHGWVKDFISWWLYPDDYEIETLQGYPIPERAGKLRYFVMDSENPIWGDSPAEVAKKAPHIFTKEQLLRWKEQRIGLSSLIKSVTFIPGSVYENKVLMDTNPQYIANLMAQPIEERIKLLGGCWKVLAGQDVLFDYAATKSLFSNSFVFGTGDKRRYLTADIALEGADKFVLMVWEGFSVIDIEVVDKSDGKEVVEIIKRKLHRFSIPQPHFVYDSDGVGGFVGGYFKQAHSFHGGAAPMQQDNVKQYYENLRTQCYYILAAKVNEYEIFINCDIEQYQTAIVAELYSTRKRPYNGQKLQILSKAEIKLKLAGKSPDFADALMMRMFFEVRKIDVGELI